MLNFHFLHKQYKLLNYNQAREFMLSRLQSLKVIRSFFAYFKKKSESRQDFEFVQSLLFWKKPETPESQLINLNLTTTGYNYVPDNWQLNLNVPTLKHGLDKYLTGQLVFGDSGVGTLPQLNQHTTNQKISQISKYIKPSEDVELIKRAKQFNCKYISSTSSITGPLTVLTYIFSCFRLPCMDNLYEGYTNKSLLWMSAYRKPTTFYLKRISQDTEAVVSDHGFLPQNNEVLMNLGHIVQYFLTHEREETERLMRGQAVKQIENYYRYLQVNNQIMLRSQIDCMSYDTQGKPYVFQIKSRACAPIRYDIQNYKQYKDYEIDTTRGLFQSFERQYYDLIRGAFMKYVMQLKIGRMDGAFIAYHNTQKIYGYEYVSLKQMAARSFGDEYNLNISFLCISKMLSTILKQIRVSLPEYKNENLKIGFYAEKKKNALCVMIQVMSQLKEYKQVKQREEFKTIYDYFSKFQKLVNPVYRMEFQFFKYVNGIKIYSPNVLLTPLDTLEMKYSFKDAVKISQQEYLTFLSSAYKEDQYYLTKMFNGYWNLLQSKLPKENK